MNKKEHNDESIELLRLHLSILNIKTQFILIDDLTKEKLENIKLELEILDNKYKKMLLNRELKNNG